MEDQLEEVFDGPIPGSSLTGEPGLEPNENPPEIVDAEEAYADIVDRISSSQSFIRLGLAAKQDIPVELIARSLLFSGWTMGKYSHDVMLLILPDIIEIMSVMLDDVGIDHIVYAKRKVDPRLLEALENVRKDEEGIQKEEEVEKPKEETEEEIEDMDEPEVEEDVTTPTTGLMGNRSEA